MQSPDLWTMGSPQIWTKALYSHRDDEADTTELRPVLTIDLQQARLPFMGFSMLARRAGEDVQLAFGSISGNLALTKNIADLVSSLPLCTRICSRS